MTYAIGRPSFHDWVVLCFAAPRGRQVVYIVEFEDGIAKVGQSRDFETRIRAHCSSPRTRGKKMLRFWHVESSAALEHEQVLLRLAGELGGTRWMNGREWFTGVDGLALIAAAERELLEPKELAA